MKLHGLSTQPLLTSGSIEIFELLYPQNRFLQKYIEHHTFKNLLLLLGSEQHLSGQFLLDEHPFFKIIVKSTNNNDMVYQKEQLLPEYRNAVVVDYGATYNILRPDPNGGLTLLDTCDTVIGHSIESVYSFYRASDVRVSICFNDRSHDHPGLLNPLP